MEINTKYDLMQQLWFMKDNKINSSTVYDIHHIRISYIGNGEYKTHIEYDMNPKGIFDEKYLYPTKEELIKTL